MIFRYKGLILILILMIAVVGCVDDSLRIQQDSIEVSTPIVIGEDSSGESGSSNETTGTVVVDSDEVQEKTLTEEVESSDSQIKSKPEAFILDDWTWERDNTLTVIEGRIHNVGDVPIGFFRIRAEYVDRDGNVVDTDLAVHGEVIWPGHQKMFKISKSYEKSHVSVRIWIDQVVAAKEPIIHAASGISAEIVQGWTWTTDGPFSYVNGSVRNVGEKDIRYYKIMAEYGDGKGQVLDSDFTNSNEVIKPGDEQRFRIMHPYDPMFQEVTIYIIQMR